MDESVARERPDDESAIIQRVLNGEREEYRHLVLAHQDRLFQIVLRQVGERQLAHDLVQETFVKAYLNLAKFRAQASFATWLTRIALNTANSYFSSAEFKRKLRSTKLDDAILTDEALPTDLTERDLLCDQLRLAVASLNAKYRDVIVLCSFNNFSYEEAAETLAVPVGTIRSRLNTARLKLREVLQRGL